MWAYESTFYQIYPLGFCGAPFENDGNLEHRILKVLDWIPHIKKLGSTAIYFSPVFESDTHGYNTRDYKKIDVRLGTNEDFKAVCDELHANGIKVVLDGVFNHVGRGFYQFQDVIKNRENSPYLSWFNVNLGGNSGYNDGLWYEGWEGNYDLVKINLRNEDVIALIFDAVRYWVEYFGIDGIRLDVAYCLDMDFMRRLRSFTDELGREQGREIFLVGEMLHGDYNRLVNDEMLHSATNYECYKGLYSSFNSMNMFEIAHSIERQFGKEPWCLYTGKHLLTFVDNHDVSRIASTLTNKAHLPLIYALMFGMPGIPCIYYGSEWGCEAVKGSGNDNILRPAFDKPEYNELTDTISSLGQMYHNSRALSYGDYTKKVLTNRQYVFKREADGEKVLVAINADENEYTAYFDTECADALNLITGKKEDLSGKIVLPPYSFRFYRCM